MNETPAADVTRLQAELKAALDKIKSLEGQAAQELEEQVSALQGEKATLATEVATLKSDLTAKSGEIAGLAAKVATLESDLAAKAAELEVIARERTDAARLATLKDKGAEPTQAETLVKQFAVLDDAAFAAVIETLAPSLKPQAAPQSRAEAEKDAITNAEPEADASLAVGDDDETESTRAEIIGWFTNRKTPQAG